MSEEKIVERICSHCRFPLPKSDSGLRHYGAHTAHQESECLSLLHAEIQRVNTLRRELQAERAQLLDRLAKSGVQERRAVAEERKRWQKWACRKEWDNVNDPPCHPGDKDWRPCENCAGPIHNPSGTSPV